MAPLFAAFAAHVFDAAVAVAYAAAVAAAAAAAPESVSFELMAVPPLLALRLALALPQVWSHSRAPLRKIRRRDVPLIAIGRRRQQRRQRRLRKGLAAAGRGSSRKAVGLPRPWRLFVGGKNGPGRSLALG